MDEQDRMAERPNSTQAETTKPTNIHLAVFVHGLWGNPAHLNNLSTSLKTACPDLHIFVAKRNTGNFTYDGIELGGERVTNEVEEEIASLSKDGKEVNKISFIGYSMGGLVARYSIGLLYSKGLLGPESGKIQPINFTTFATPHLGTRTPSIGWQNDVWNALGARSLSASGNQMWTIDKFRDTDRPLLAVMASPDSIFMKGLALFSKKSLYANIVNDRAVAFHTAYISDIDPFVDPTAVKIDYEPGYEDVIVSPSLASPKDTPATWGERSNQVLGKLPFYLAVGVFAPIGALVFFGNAAVQSFTSAQRIKAHEDGTSGIDIAAYRSSLMADKIQRTADHALERLNSAEGEQFVPAEKGNAAGHNELQTSGTGAITSDNAVIPVAVHAFPKLALTEEQIGMKKSLDAIGVSKYAVHIKNVGHSHAAIIRRTDRAGFSEGKVVSRHWTERFET